MAVSGDTAVVGAQDTPAPDHFGAAYIFIRQGTVWTQQAALSDPAGVADDQYGYAVALSGDTLVVGAPGAAGLSTATGAAYVYGRSGGIWTLQATLRASDGAFNDGFGSSVAISGTTVVVGAPAKNNMSGATYLYVRSGSTWAQQAALSDPAGAFAEFGWAVAVSGNTAVISAAQAPDTYVYARSGGAWAQQAALHAPAPGRYFGVAVALSGNTALVSACCGVTQVNGLVYVFGRSGSAWTLHAALKPPAGITDSSFGYALALSGHTAVIGGGPTYVYAGSGSVWSEQSQLIAADRPPSAIGAAVAVWRQTAIVGATGPSGAAYVFTRSVTAADAVDDAEMRRAPGPAGRLTTRRLR